MIDTALARASRFVVAVASHEDVRKLMTQHLAPEFDVQERDSVESALATVTEDTSAVVVDAALLHAGQRLRAAHPELPIIVLHTKGSSADPIAAINTYQPFAWASAGELLSCVSRAAARRDAWRAQNMTDALTGVANRRYFFSAYQKMLLQAVRTHRPFSLLIIDIDHFKVINTQYGNPHGDAVLKNISYMLRDNARSIDVLARINGDQFALALPETDLAGAKGCADRLRLGVQSFNFVPHAHAGDGHPLSLAIGGCVLHAAREAVPAELFFSRALGALEVAQSRGTAQVNCVTYGDSTAD